MRYSGDLAELMLKVATGKLAEAEAPKFVPDTALTVVMAANGYPGTAQTGGVISFGSVNSGKIFQAGTAEKDGNLVAVGGRVLNVTATGHNVTEAQAAAYSAVDSVNFPTGFCRRDIGWREVEREAGRWYRSAGPE